MKQNILVIYYSQSGQLREILDNMLSDIHEKVDVSIVEIKPINPFPFPWNAKAFFDVMPECVQLVPAPIQPIPQEIVNGNYDLVLLGYQSWFLHPSIPITSFLKSDSALVLKNRPVVTVIGCRNMWLNSQERVKEMLRGIGANLVGNIVLTDKHSNLISVMSIMRWAFKGQKEASGLLPEAGVSGRDIKDAQRFCSIIEQHLTNNQLDTLHEELLAKGAIHLEPGLVLLEKKGVKNFRKFAAYIREKGGPGAIERQGRVNKFKNLLAVAIFILSPITSVVAAIQVMLQKSSLLKDVEYFKSVKFEKDRI